MMDCDTTGVEPDLALVKYKKLGGGGLMKIVNQTVPSALARLGYQDKEVDAITDYVHKNGFIEGAPLLRDEHLPVFDCAVQSPGAERSIHYMGHVKMMSAVQPFLSGAISKTVNMPNASTIEEIMQTYVEAWKLGLKSIANLSGRQQADAAPEHFGASQRHPSGSTTRATQASCRATGHYAQVQHSGARGLHHRRHVRRRLAR